MPRTLRNPSRSPADEAAAHEAQAKDHRRQAELALAEPITGPRGELLSLKGAVELGEQIRKAVTAEEVPPGESQRHLLVRRRTTIAGFCIVGLVDLPVVVWISAGVFNVDPSRPLSLRLVIAIVVAILVTAGAAAALFHCGNSLRNVKNYRRSLEFGALTLGSTLTFIGACALAGSIAALAYWRIATEGVFSRQGWVAILLAGLAALVMLISAALIAANAFRDGSNMTDDLAFLNRVVQRRLRIVNALQQKAHEHQRDGGLINGSGRHAIEYDDDHDNEDDGRARQSG